MLILDVKGFIKIKANFSLVYVIMTLVIEMKKIVIKENDANQRIDKYLKKLLCNAPSNFIYKMFRKKDIKINGKKVNEKYILQKDDILEMFLDFIQDEEHSILVSSHITSDLEKIADYIVFIHEGKVLFSRPKDELTEQYGIIKCNAKQFDELNKNDIIRYKKQDYEWQVLVANRQKAKKEYPHTLVVPASIDDIMLLYVKGEC